MDAARPMLSNRAEVVRAKGLGALSAEMARESMFSSKYQKLEVLEYSDEAIQLLKDLMGDSVAKRKNFIFQNIDFSTIRE